ncbi:MAG: outer membrane beta-barrel protein [Bacteroidota bacterium]
MKNILLTVFAILIILPLSAQEGAKIGFRISPLISFGTIIDDSTQNRLDIGQGSKIGFGFGVVGSYGFTENYGIHTGLNIVYRGFTSDQGGFSSRFRYTTVEIPVALKLRSNAINGGNIHVKGIFGGSIDLNVGFKGVTEVSGTETETRSTDNINLFNASFIAGGGIDYILDGVGMFDVVVMYHNGLLNANDKEDGLVNTIVRLNYISLDLGYYF